MNHERCSSHPFHFNDLLGLLPWFPPGPVCDIGTGKGHLSAAIAAYGFAVEALDVDPQTLEHAAQAYGKKVSWLHQDIRGYRLQRESYAAIFCINVFPFIPNGERARIIGRLKAALKPGGFLIVSGLTAADSALQEKWARSSNQISFMPTGIFDEQELDQRLHDWDILFSFVGSASVEINTATKEHQISQIIARKPRSIDTAEWSKMPHLGLGLNTYQDAPKIALSTQDFDFIQIKADDYLEPFQDIRLTHLCRNKRVIPHAQGLSLGSPELRQDGYLEALSRVIARCEAPWWSESLAYSRSDLQESLLLHPLPPTEEALEVVKKNIRQVRQVITAPLLLENIAYQQELPTGDMNEATFLRHVTLEADCGIVLNVSNLLYNAYVFAFDPETFIQQLPLDRIIQVSIGTTNQEYHSKLDFNPVWSLCQYLLRHCDIRAICLGDQAAQTIPKELKHVLVSPQKVTGASH